MYKRNIAVVRYKVGNRIPLTFCNEKCYKEYEGKYLKEFRSKGRLENDKNKTT